MFSNNEMDLFKQQFLKYYLMSGFGTLPKKDIDSLVMHLLCEYGMSDGKPLKERSNQELSITLKIPANRVKAIRYEAALKFGGVDEKKVKFDLLKILAKAHFEKEKDRIIFIIEDKYIRNWVQGMLKDKGMVFDTSFNTDIVKINTDDFCDLLSQLFDREAVQNLKKGIEQAREQKSDIRFSELKKEFLKGAANGLGSGITQTAVTLLMSLAKR